MFHDFSIVFDITNPIWNKILDIFDKNEKYPKIKVKGRNLHHKFPKSFSKILGEQQDNDFDNLISLTPGDHFLVHYYYYLIAKTGYKGSMAMAFQFMTKKCIKYITEDTAISMSKDFNDAKIIAAEYISKKLTGRESVFKGHKHTEYSKKLIREHHADFSGKNHPQYGTHISNNTKAKISKANTGKRMSEENRIKVSKRFKGKPLSEEHKLKISNSHKGKKLSEEHKQKLKQVWIKKRNS